MKLNKKGFTLIELLVTILIVGLVIGFSAYGIISIIDNSSEQAVVLSENNLKEAARIYSREVSSDSWKTNGEYEYFCVTVGELMNKGLLDKKAEINGNITRNDFVIVKRNKVTFVNIKEEIAKNGNNYELCTGSDSNSNEVVTAPVVRDYSSTTDKIVISFTPGSASYNGNSSTTSYKCLYGTTSNNLNIEGTISCNTCVLNGLKNNTNYYAVIYMNTNNGSSVPATGNNNFKTTDFNKPNISQSGNDITIIYNNEDSSNNVINPVYHYFKATYNGTSNIEVSSCTDSLSCSGTTKTIEKNVWYKVSGTVIVSPNIKEEDASVYARTYDGSNNYVENGFEVNWVDDSPPDPPKYDAKHTLDDSSYTSGNWTNKEVMTTISSDYNGSGNIYFQYQKAGEEIWNNLGGTVTSSGDKWSVDEVWTIPTDANGNKIAKDDTYYFRACINENKCSDKSKEAFNIKYDPVFPEIDYNRSVSTGPNYSYNVSYSDEHSGVDSSTVKWKTRYGTSYKDFYRVYDTVAENTWSYNSYGSSYLNSSSYYEVVFRVCDNVGNCTETDSSKMDFRCPSGYKYGDPLSNGNVCYTEESTPTGTCSGSCGSNEKIFSPNSCDDIGYYCVLKGRHSADNY